MFNEESMPTRLTLFMGLTAWPSILTGIEGYRCNAGLSLIRCRRPSYLHSPFRRRLNRPQPTQDPGHEDVGRKPNPAGHRPPSRIRRWPALQRSRARTMDTVVSSVR